jgi:predicted patatin/cPLA2 family phospholipase
MSGNRIHYFFLFFFLFMAFYPPIRGSCNILLLSGGGAYGAFEAGVISRLVENGSRWDYLTGVSAGSINAFFLSSLGYPANLTNILRNSWSDLKNDNVYRITPLDWLRELATNEPLEQTLKNKVEEYGLNEMQIPVYMGTVSMEDGIFYQWYLKNNATKDVIDLVMASSNIPIVFAPHYFAGSYWIDGGTLRNIIVEEPVIQCLQRGETEIMIDMVTVNNPVGYVNPAEIKNWYLWDYVVRTISLLYQNMGDVELHCDYDANIYARRYKPIAKPYSFLDFTKGAELFEMGYNTTEYTITRIC